MTERGLRPDPLDAVYEDEEDFFDALAGEEPPSAPAPTPAARALRRTVLGAVLGAAIGLAAVSALHRPASRAPTDPRSPEAAPPLNQSAGQGQRIVGRRRRRARPHAFVHVRSSTVGLGTHLAVAGPSGTTPPDTAGSGVAVATRGLVDDTPSAETEFGFER